MELMKGMKMYWERGGGGGGERVGEGVCVCVYGGGVEQSSAHLELYFGFGVKIKMCVRACACETIFKLWHSNLINMTVDIILCMAYYMLILMTLTLMQARSVFSGLAEEKNQQ